MVISSGRASTYTSVDTVATPSVVIVFGAGLTRSGAPSDALMDRLTIAAQLYAAGKATRILVSGDNRFVNYNEPQVMHDTLVEKFHIPKEMIATDFAGRRTYDTCARAYEIWGVETAILVTQGYHLARAIWTCKHLGIESRGISASLQPYVQDAMFKLREVGAIYKAAIDVYFLKPDYIGGDAEEDLDP